LTPPPLCLPFPVLCAVCCCSRTVVGCRACSPHPTRTDGAHAGMRTWCSVRPRPRPRPRPRLPQGSRGPASPSVSPRWKRVLVCLAEPALLARPAAAAACLGHRPQEAASWVALLPVVCSATAAAAAFPTPAPRRAQVSTRAQHDTTLDCSVSSDALSAQVVAASSQVAASSAAALLLVVMVVVRSRRQSLSTR
jgi:hypothetical protein